MSRYYRHIVRSNKPRGKKLTLFKVQEIRRLWAENGTSKEILATQFGVAPDTIDSVIRGKTWKELVR